MSLPASQKQKERFAFLKRLYELADGDSNETADAEKIGADIGISRDQVAKIMTYLRNEDLATFRYLGSMEVSITHSGVKEVEDALHRPDQPTEHFPATINNYVTIGNVHGSQVQVGAINSHQTTLQVSQQELAGVLEDLRKMIASSQAGAEQKDLADSCIDVLKAQSALPAENRDGSAIEKAWDRLGKISKVISVGGAMYKLSKIVALYFGIDLPGF